MGAGSGVVMSATAGFKAGQARLAGTISARVIVCLAPEGEL